MILWVLDTIFAEELLEKLVEEDVPQKVVTLISQHENNPRIVSNCCFILSNLVIECKKLNFASFLPPACKNITWTFFEKIWYKACQYMTL